jgi:hypothetical protein
MTGLAYNVYLFTQDDSISFSQLAMQWEQQTLRGKMGVNLGVDTSLPPEIVARRMKEVIEEGRMKEEVRFAVTPHLEKIAFYNGFRRGKDVSNQLQEDYFKTIISLLGTFPPVFHYSPRIFLGE